MTENFPVNRIEAVLLKVLEVSERLARCAEAVSNPTYSIQGVDAIGRRVLLEIQAIRSVSGEIIITVKLPDDRKPVPEHLALPPSRFAKGLIDHD